MQFLAPIALALLALSIPILLLWMLRLRRREVTVPSTLLWSRLLLDREANTPWQRLRRNLLLLLQLAILLTLVFALARPYLPVPAVARGAVVLLLDASASMNATDVEPSRFSVARRAAEEMINKLDADGIMTVIAVGDQPQILAAATGDKAKLREIIDQARPTQAPADWTSAFSLAAGATSGAAESTIVIISDGNLPSNLPPLPGEVRYIPIGDQGGTDNLAITALAIRDGVNGPELFASIANTSPLTRPAADPLLSIYLDNVLYESRRLQVPAGESRALTLSGVPGDPHLIEARLAAGDSLALDDTAWTVRQPSGRRRVLIVSEGSLFLERAIAALPDTNAFRTSSGSAPPTEPYDLIVYDRTLPAEPPATPLLIIDPPLQNGFLTVTGAFSDTQISAVADHSLLSHVNLSQVQILQARSIELPDWPGLRQLVTARGGPLMLVGEPDGRRVALLTFDLHQSDLPLQIAFPILISNLVDWLTPGLPFDAENGLRPGEPLVLFPGDAEEIRISRPDGSIWAAALDANLVFGETDILGLYRLDLDDLPAGHFAVNLFDLSESTLTRQETIIVGEAEISPTGGQELGQRELWPWLAAGGLALLLIEWWVYHQGAGPRKSNPRIR